MREKPDIDTIQRKVEPSDSLAFEKDKATPRKAKMKDEDAVDTAPAAAEPQLLPLLQQVLAG